MKIENVEQAVKALRGRGEPVSHRSVLAEMGRGSLRDVTKLMQQLTDPDQAPQALDTVQHLLAPVLPLVDLLQELDLLTHCYQYLRTAVPRELDTYEQQRQALTGTIAQLREEQRQLEAMIDALQQTVTSLKGELREVVHGHETLGDALGAEIEGALDPV